MKFYICNHCGNIIEFAKASGVPVMCCGEKMTELVPGTSDGAYEKHVPVVTVNGNNVLVSVGAVAHPMIEAHYIEWICLETEDGLQFKQLKPDMKPSISFLIEKEKIKAVYAFCNKHSLWKA